MDFSECLEPGCDQATSTTDGGHWVDGVDFDGVDVEFWLDKFMCAAGHRYHVVDESRTRIPV